MATSSQWSNHALSSSWNRNQVPVFREPQNQKRENVLEKSEHTRTNTTGKRPLHYFKLCAAFRSHWWIRTEVTVRKRPIWVKINVFFCVWPWNLTDDLEKQQDTSPKHYQAICIISSSYVNSNWSYSPETPNLGQIRQFLEPCDLEIWWITLKNNRAPLLCYFKLCASFHSQLWIQTGVTVWKRLS